MDAPVAERRLRFSLRELFVLTAVIGGVLAIIVPAMRVAREEARKSICAGHFKQIALAHHNYHDINQQFAPSRYVTADGTPQHSWRVLLAPFIESGPFYSQYRLDEPWNGPTNKQLIGPEWPWHHCPSATQPTKNNTNYILVTGPRTIFPLDNLSLTFKDITDGLSNTLLVGEMDPPAIHWLEPRDLDFATLPLQINSRSRPCLSSRHGKGINAAMADGSLIFLDSSTPAATLKSYLLIDDAPSSPRAP
jgi:prepilin-type processing-associated H-X9-DG protein